MREERVPENNLQFEKAQDKEHKINLSLLQAARETFLTLFYPYKQDGEDILLNADFLMEFDNNCFNGENQIRDLLIRRMKFLEDTTTDSFRQKCEARLFTQKEMRWTDVKRRAATNPMWNWHHPNALDDLLDRMLSQESWRENGSGYIEKPPFPKEKTDVLIQVKNKDLESGETTLKIIPKYGDLVYWEVGSEPTSASNKIEDFDNFTTDEIKINFLCVDSTGEHKTGKYKIWTNELQVRYKLYDDDDERKIQLKTNPNATIRYTTDGSDPKENGGIYENDVTIPKNCKYVLAVAETQDVYSDRLTVKIDEEEKGLSIDKSRKLTFNPKKQIKANDTKETFEELKILKRHNAKISESSIYAEIDELGNYRWVMLSVADKLFLSVEVIEKQIENLRTIFLDDKNPNIRIDINKIRFTTGQDFLDWIATKKLTKSNIKSEEIYQ